MATGGPGSASGPGSMVQSLPPPRPKSPPDLYGRRKEMLRIQVLEREKSFLEEELKSAQQLQPASRCCKDVVDFVSANADPLLPINRKISKPCHLWKWLCGSSCFNLSWICCCTGCTNCTLHVKPPKCCSCDLGGCTSCIRCTFPKCSCCSLPKSSCSLPNCWLPNCSCSCSSPCSACSCVKNPCCQSCFSCFDCCSCSCKCKCSCPKCPTYSCSKLCPDCNCSCPKCPNCSNICNSCLGCVGCIANCCCCDNCCICC